MIQSTSRRDISPPDNLTEHPLNHNSWYFARPNSLSITPAIVPIMEHLVAYLETLDPEGAVASTVDGEFFTLKEFAFQPQTQQNPHRGLMKAQTEARV
jgi:hypothetical protein